MNTDRFTFRVWDIKNKRYLETLNGLYFKPHPKGLKALTWFIEQEDYIVEQCTGLKGDNGKLIYEGDIIETEEGNGAVCWWSSYLRWVVSGFHFDFSLSFFKKNLKIIGNIHENMELVK